MLIILVINLIIILNTYFWLCRIISKNKSPTSTLPHLPINNSIKDHKFIKKRRWYEPKQITDIFKVLQQ